VVWNIFYFSDFSSQLTFILFRGVGISPTSNRLTIIFWLRTHGDILSDRHVHGKTGNPTGGCGFAGFQRRDVHFTGFTHLAPSHQAPGWDNHRAMGWILQPKPWPWWLRSKVGSHVQEDGIGCGASWTSDVRNLGELGGILGSEITNSWFLPLYHVLTGVSGLFFSIVPSIHLSLSLFLCIYQLMNQQNNLFTSIYWFIYLFKLFRHI